MPPAVVMAYGKVLKEPMAFSGVGGDTLFLNGLPYSPLRRIENAEAAIPTPPQHPPDYDLHASALDDLNEQVRAIRERLGAEHPDLGAAIADLYRNHPSVDSVLSYGQSSILVKFTFADLPHELLWNPPEDLPSERPTRKEIHDEKMETFWKRHGAGGFIAFGSVYEHYVSSRRAKQMLDLIDAAKGGTRLDLDAQPAPVRDVLDDLEFTE
jgi:hypothetical protein